MTGTGRGSAGYSRAQSSPIAIVLVFGLVIASTTIIVVAGGSAISSTQNQLSAQNAETKMTQLDSQMATVALGSSASQEVALGTSSNYKVNSSAGHMTIRFQDGTTPIDTSLGAIVYEGEDGQQVAYQGGGVWRSSATDNGSVMVSPPEFHYQDGTLTLPLVTIGNDASFNGNAVIKPNSTTQRYPNITAGNTNPISNGPVTVTVTSEYYRGWGQYFDSRTVGTPTYDHDNNTVVLTLTIPGNNGPVQGGLVSGAVGTSATFNENAEADSYDSSVDPYSISKSDETTILFAGDATIDNKGVIDGDLIVGGDVTIDNNADINGNLEYGGTASGGGYPGNVDGYTANNGSVVSPDSVEAEIDTQRSAFKTENNNDDSSVDVDESTKTLENCASTCELTAGNYYLDSISLNRDQQLQINTTGGPVNIVVNGSVFIGSSGTTYTDVINVTGSNRVNFYVEGDWTFKNNVENNVPGDKSTNFWVYMNPDSDAEFANNAKFIGVLYGPGKGTNLGVEATLKQNAEVYGGVVGGITSVSQNYEIHYDKALSSTQSVQDPKTYPSLTYLHVSENSVNVTSD